jgi:hypothetical protein
VYALPIEDPLINWPLHLNENPFRRPLDWILGIAVTPRAANRSTNSGAVGRSAATSSMIAANSDT